MAREVEIHGCVTTSKTVEEFTDELITWIESRGESFGGSCKEFTGVDDQLEIRENKKVKVTVEKIEGDPVSYLLKRAKT